MQRSLPLGIVLALTVGIGALASPALAAVAPPAGATVARPPASARTLTDRDREVLESYTEALNLARQKAQHLWPGFRFDRSPAAFYDPGRILLLVNHPHPPRAFTRVRFAALDGLGVKVYAHWGDVKDLDTPMQGLPRIGGVTTPLMHYGYLFSTGHPNPLAYWIPVFTAETGVYEQEKRAEEDRSSYPSADPQNRVDSELEDHRLLAALKADDPDAIRKDASEFIAVRIERHGRLTPRAIAFEQASELYGATAMYTNFHFVQMGTDPDYRPTSFVARTGFHWTPATQAFGEEAHYLAGPLDQMDLLRDRYGYTGLAEGMILDALSYPWKAQAKAGTPMATLVARAVGYRPADQARLLAAARSTEDYAAILDRAKAEAAHDPQTLQAFLQSPGLRVTMSLAPVQDDPDDPGNPEESGRTQWLRVRSGPRPLVVDDKTLLAYQLDLFNYRNGPTWVKTENTPMEMVHAAPEPWPFQEVTFFVQAPRIALDGQAFALHDGSFPYDRLSIHGDHALVADTHGTLLVQGNSVTLRH